MNTNDINKLGKKLELYNSVSYIGKGFPIFLPRGAKIVKIIRDYIESEEEKAGYSILRTPSVSRAEIYRIEDRLESQKDEMFIIKSQDEEDNSIVLRPYSMPFHCSVYSLKQHSYKELPVKFSETSTVFRNERDIKGIGRTRQITMSDASIFTTHEGLTKQIKESLNLQKKCIDNLGLEVRYAISNWDNTRKEDYIGTINEWDYAVSSMKKALEDMKIEYTEDDNARMYGPSIVAYIGRQELSRVQIDFEIVHRFDLKYVNSENEEVFPIYIHRTSIGSYERLLEILIEKYQGEFPLWIAPVQVQIISAGEEFDDYVKEIKDRMIRENIRVEEDKSDNNIQSKEYRAVDLKVPYIVKIGKKQYNDKSVEVRSNVGTREMELDDLINEIKNKSAMK